MPHGSSERSPVKKPRDVVFGAEVAKYEQNLQFCGLQLFQSFVSIHRLLAFLDCRFLAKKNAIIALPLP